MSIDSELSDHMDESHLGFIPEYWANATTKNDKGKRAWGAFMYAYARLDFDFMEFFIGSSKKPCRFCRKTLQKPFVKDEVSDV